MERTKERDQTPTSSVHPFMAVDKASTSSKTNKRPRGDRTVNDEEVEEFFTILKRLQRLRGGTDRRSCRMTWRPEFTLDDFKETRDGHDRSDDVARREERDREGDRETTGVSRSFDLNMVPEASDIEILDD